MGRPATPREKEKFVLLLREGYTVAEACREVNKSYSWGRDQVRKLKAENLLDPRQVARSKDWRSPVDGKVYPAQKGGMNEFMAPLEYHELSPEAQRALEDPAYFRARYFGRKSSPWQEDAMIRMKELHESPKKEYVVVNAPPGGGKSTLFTHDTPAWLTCRSRSIRGFIGSAAQTTADSYTGQLMNTFERNYPVQASTEEIEADLAYDAESTLPADFGLFKPTIPKIWRRRQFTVAQLSGQVATGNKESTWTAWGEDSLFLGWRVNFIMWDDLVTDDMIGNLDRIEKQRRWWSNTAERRLEPRGVLVLQGQRMYADDLYQWCLSLDAGTSTIPSDIVEIDASKGERAGKKYHHIVYKAHYEDKCKGEFIEERDEAGHVTLVPNPDHAFDGPPHQVDGSGGCLLDPVRISYEECKAEEAKPFSQYRIVFQQEDVDPASVLVPELWVNGGTDKNGREHLGCKDMDRGIAELPPGIIGIQSSTVSVDPSPSRFWSIQWWIYAHPPEADHLMGFRYLMDHLRTPMKASDFLDYNLSTRSYVGVIEEWWWRAKEMGHPITTLVVETNAAQKFMMQYEYFQRWSQARGVALIPHHTGKNKSDPDYGVGMIAPHWEFGRVRLPYLGPDARLASDYLISEVTRYPNALTDDALMAHWFHEYSLQHTAQRAIQLDNFYDDMPSWMRPKEGEHRLFQFATNPLDVKDN